MENKKLSLEEFSEKVLQGTRQAIRKLIEKRAASNDELIVADKNGNPVSVPAKELLKTLK